MLKLYLFFKASLSELGFTQAHILWKLVVKRPAREADHLSYLAVTLIMNESVPAVLRKPS